MEELLTKQGEPIAFWIREEKPHDYKTLKGETRHTKGHADQVYVGSMKPGGVGAIWGKEGKIGNYII